MISLHFPDLRLTANRLFTGEDFDAFLVSEMSLSTLCTFQIDGHIPADYYTQEEQEALPDAKLTAWKQLRPLVCQLIRGRRLPAQFKIVFRLAGYNVEKFLRQTGLPYSPGEKFFWRKAFAIRSPGCWWRCSAMAPQTSKNAWMRCMPRK